MSYLYRFEPCGSRWTIEAYEDAPGTSKPRRIGGSPGTFDLIDGPACTDFFRGPEEDALTAEQRAWFLCVFEGGPMPQVA